MPWIQADCGCAGAEGSVIVVPDLHQVWVIQDKLSGMFLHLDLYLTKSLKDAGRAPDPLCARETAELNLSGPYDIHTFWESR